MSDYSFRVRLVMAPNEQVNLEVEEYQLPDVWPFPLRIISGDQGKSIREASNLLLRAQGFSTEQEAELAAQACRDSFIISLAHLKIGADFGDRAPTSGFFNAGLKLLERSMGNRVLNDYHGIMTFVTDPPPRFARAGPARGIRGRNEDRFVNSLRRSAHTNKFLTERERLSFDLFSASYFQPSQDARLVLLVMAVETLLTPQPRATEAVEHVEEMIRMTQASPTLSQSDRDSILGSLQHLKFESIRQSARRLMRDVLPDEEYMALPSDRFVSEVYNLRSRLVHGSKPFPTRREVSTVAASLETLVGDLLSAPHLRSAS